MFDARELADFELAASECWLGNKELVLLIATLLLVLSGGALLPPPQPVSSAKHIAGSNLLMIISAYSVNR